MEREPGPAQPRHRTSRRSSVSATTAIYGSTPRPRRSSPTSCSSCCCASRSTWSPSPLSTSAPSPRDARPPQPYAPPTGPAPSASWSRSSARPRRAARRPGASLAGTGREAGASGLGWDGMPAGRTPEARFPACGFNGNKRGAPQPLL